MVAHELRDGGAWARGLWHVIFWGCGRWARGLWHVIFRGCGAWARGLWRVGSGVRLSGCGAEAHSVAPRLSLSAACGTLPDQSSHPCLWHRQVEPAGKPLGGSYPLRTSCPVAEGTDTGLVRNLVDSQALKHSLEPLTTLDRACPLAFHASSSQCL